MPLLSPRQSGRHVGEEPARANRPPARRQRPGSTGCGSYAFFTLTAAGRCRMTAQPLRVWLVDDDTSIRWVLERALKNGGMVPKAFDAAEPALAALRNDTPDVLITDIRMSGQSGLDLLRRVHDAHPELPVIVMTAYSDLGSAVMTMT